MIQKAAPKVSERWRDMSGFSFQRSVSGSGQEDRWEEQARKHGDL